MDCLRHPLREDRHRIFALMNRPDPCLRIHRHPFEEGREEAMISGIMTLMDPRIMDRHLEVAEDLEAAVAEDEVGDSFVDADGDVEDEVVAMAA